MRKKEKIIVTIPVSSSLGKSCIVIPIFPKYTRKIEEFIYWRNFLSLPHVECQHIHVKVHKPALPSIFRCMDCEASLHGFKSLALLFILV